jgi:hypothetical protein
LSIAWSRRLLVSPDQPVVTIVPSTSRYLPVNFANRAEGDVVASEIQARKRPGTPAATAASEHRLSASAIDVGRVCALLVTKTSREVPPSRTQLAPSAL